MFELKLRKRAIALLLAVFIVLTLVACNQNGNENSSNNLSSSSQALNQSQENSSNKEENSSSQNQPVRDGYVLFEEYKDVEFDVTTSHRYVVSVARNTPILEANTGYNCAKIPVESGKRYILTFAIQSAKSYGVILTDSETRVKEQLFVGSNSLEQLVNIQLTIPEGVAYLFINSRIEVEISVKELYKTEKLEDEVVNLPNDLLIGCANCGKFSYTDGVTDTLTYQNQWEAMIAEREYTLFSYEDVAENFATGITANSVFESSGATVYNVDGFAHCLRMASKYAPVTKAIVPFADSHPSKSTKTKRYYALRLTYYIGGKSLAVYGLHFVAEAHISSTKEADGTSISQKLRQLQFAGLIADSKNYDEAIFIGDFNAQESFEYDIFRENGFSLVNCGIYGEFATLRDIPADNIIVSSGFKINSIRLLKDYNLSTDHTAISASVSLK